MLTIGDARADDVFAEALRIAGVGRATAWLMVQAVRLRSRTRRTTGLKSASGGS